MSPELYPHKRPETKLLLCCTRTCMEPKTAECVRQLLKATIDWNYLIQAASCHGTLPLLYRNLNKLCPDEVPNTTLNQLKSVFYALAWRNLYLTGELLRLLALFRNRGLRAFPFKGPVLAATAYGNLSLRHFGDLDILMPRENIPAAKDILVRQGYCPKFQFTPSEEAAYLRSHHDYKFVRFKDGLIVEIQWGVTQWSFPFPIDFEELWRHRKEVCLAGSTVFNLSLEHTLLILCVHGTKHRWEQLLWICDVAELINAYRQRIDWERLMKRARTLGGLRMLLLGLFLAHDLLGAALPENVLKKIRDGRHIKYLASRVQAWLFREMSQPVRLSDERPFFYLQVREKLGDKIALVWKYFPEYFFRAVGRVKKGMRTYSYLHFSSLALLPVDIFY